VSRLLRPRNGEFRRNLGPSLRKESLHPCRWHYFSGCLSTGFVFFIFSAPLNHPGGPRTYREPLRTYRKLLERTAHRTWEPIGLKWFDGTKTGNQSAKNGLTGAILGTNSSKLAQTFAPTEPLPKRLLYTYIGPLNHRSRTTPFK